MSRRSGDVDRAVGSTGTAPNPRANARRAASGSDTITSAPASTAIAATVSPIRPAPVTSTRAPSRSTRADAASRAATAVPVAHEAGATTRLGTSSPDVHDVGADAQLHVGGEPARQLPPAVDPLVSVLRQRPALLRDAPRAAVALAAADRDRPDDPVAELQGDAVDATSTLAHRDDATHLLVPEHERRVRPAFAAHGPHVGGADGGELDLDERLAR